MQLRTINKHSSKLKIWSVEMPNAPYSKPLGGIIKDLNNMKKTLLIILIFNTLLGCQQISKENDIEVINQIFPELIKEMELLTIKPFGPPPPLPASFAPYFLDNKNSDTCINLKDLMAYRLSFLKYRNDFEKYVIESYPFEFKSNKVVIGIEDSLYSLRGYLENKFIKKELSRHYLTAYDNINNSNIDNKKFELNKITNTGMFRLQYSSELGWYPKIDMNFWENPNDFYLSGILSFSRIYFDESKNYGVFYCTKFGNEKEPTPLLICIKKTGNNWTIEKTILR
jgi:hypothetical protein